MAWPFFSLAKSRRTAPIDFRSGSVTVQVVGADGHGIATIWDADVLIWAASQWMQARDVGLPTSRRIVTPPYELLRFVGRATSLRDYHRLSASFDRLPSTSMATPLHKPTGRRLPRF